MLHFHTGCCRYSASKFLEDVANRMQSLVMFRKDGDLAVTGVQAPGVGEAETACCWDVELETAVMIACWANVETICCMGSPGSAHGWVVVNQCFCAKRRERRFAEVEWTVEFLVG